MSDQPIRKQVLLNSLPPEWPSDPFPEVQRRIERADRKLVVLDDDPTGTQTVHGVPVLTRWSVKSLEAQFLGSSPAFFLLTNSRSLSPARARELNSAIGRDLLKAAGRAGKDFAVVSRSDSTLRGHFPDEIESLAAALRQHFDAWLLVPFFLEGGRYTINDTHYVAEGDWLVPVGQTEYAEDAAFGYSASDLRRWVVEKTGGEVPFQSVASISIEDIRCGGPRRVADRLTDLSQGTVCVVNAASMRDLEVFVHGLLTAEGRGRRFLYRTAASFVRVRAAISPRALLTQDDFDLPPSRGGLFVVGSYVPKTTHQLNALLAETKTRGIEVQAELLLDDARRQDEIIRVARQANQSLENDEDVAIYTSRRPVAAADAVDSLSRPNLARAGSPDSGQERGFDDPRGSELGLLSLSIGQRISEGIVAIVHAVSARPRYVVAKGGITSSDVATYGFDVRRASVLGQILPGVPVWRLGPESRYPGLVYVVFPGNVGDSEALVNVAAVLKPATKSAPASEGA